MANMKKMKRGSLLDGLADSLAKCLTPETAKRVLALKSEPSVQARVADLSKRHMLGQLTDVELMEYREYTLRGQQ